LSLYFSPLTFQMRTIDVGTIFAYYKERATNEITLAIGTLEQG